MTGRRARVAFLVTSYVAPEQVLRLARTLRAGSAEAALVLHHDPRRGGVDEAALAALGVVRVVPPSLPAWGEGSQLAMVLRGLRTVAERTDAEWVVLLSGQDYPIRPVAEIERRLAVAGVDAFLAARPVAPPGRGERRVAEFAQRYHYRWRPARRVPWWLLRRAGRLRPLVQVREMPSGPWVGVRRSPALPVHQGGDWFTLNARGLRAVLDAPEGLRGHFARTLIPTEGFVHTVLANAPGIVLDPDARRFTRWDDQAWRPRVLGLADLPAMLASGADVARKFDPAIDRAVLDAIDREVHGPA